MGLFFSIVDSYEATGTQSGAENAREPQTISPLALSGKAILWMHKGKYLVDSIMAETRGQQLITTN